MFTPGNQTILLGVAAALFAECVLVGEILWGVPTFCVASLCLFVPAVSGLALAHRWPSTVLASTPAIAWLSVQVMAKMTMPFIRPYVCGIEAGAIEWHEGFEERAFYVFSCFAVALPLAGAAAWHIRNRARRSDTPMDPLQPVTPYRTPARAGSKGTVGRRAWFWRCALAVVGVIFSFDTVSYARVAFCWWNP